MNDRIPITTLAPGAHIGLTSTGSDELVAGVGTVAFDLLEQSLGKETAHEVLRTFTNFSLELTSELDSAVQRRDLVSARSITNELSRSCIVVGANVVLMSCTSMLEHLQAPDWDRAEIGMKTLLAKTRALRKALRLLLS